MTAGGRQIVRRSRGFAPNRIIHTMHNLPIMNEDRIGNLGESPLCGRIVIDNRFCA